MAIAALNRAFLRAAQINLDIKKVFEDLLSLIDAGFTAAALPVTRTLAATGTVTAVDNGSTIFLNSATGFVTTLPTPAAAGAGFRVNFVNKLANTSGNHTVVTAASANIINGAVFCAADAVGDTGTTDDTINFVVNTSTPGDRVELTTDGTTWFALAFVKVTAAVTFTTAS